MTRPGTLRGGGFELAASWYDPGGDPIARALVLHGWSGSRSGSSATVGAALADIGVAGLVPDLPGHGDSPGTRTELTRDRFVQVALDTFDELVRGIEEPVPTIVVGTSFGGFLAAQLTSARHVDALVLRVPADYPDEGHDTQPMGELFDEGDRTRIARWRTQSPAPGGTRSLRAIAGLQAPLLVQQAELDEDVPAVQVQAMVAAHPNPQLVTHELLRGAPHALSTSPAHLAAANEQLVAWLQLVLAR